LGVEGMERSYRPTAYLGFGRVFFNIAASDAPEPLSPSWSARLAFRDACATLAALPLGHSDAPEGSAAGPIAKVRFPVSAPEEHTGQGGHGRIADQLEQGPNE
jgi:hypothetical protein